VRAEGISLVESKGLTDGALNKSRGGLVAIVLARGGARDASGHITVGATGARQLLAT
jgi:hypothetical protein